MTTLQLEVKSTGWAMPMLAKSGQANGKAISGYLTHWLEVDHVRDRTIRGAFAGAIAANKKYPLLWAHDEKQIPIGSITGMVETDTGVYFEALLNDTRMGLDAQKAVQAGDVSGVSYGYDPKKTRLSLVDGKTVRDLQSLDLYEVSLCLWPALDSARIGARKSQMLDELAIGRYLLREVQSLPISDYLLRKYIEAEKRAAERLLHAGKTLHELLYEIAYEQQELAKLH